MLLIKRILFGIASRFFGRLRYAGRVKLGYGARINFGNSFSGFNYIGAYSRVCDSSLGRASYIANNSIITRAEIGDFTCIGDYVRVGVGRHPTRSFVSLHPSFYSLTPPVGLTLVDSPMFDEHIYSDKDKKFYVQIGSDVWIGNNVTIMDGLKIGHGAVIGTGSVVTKDVEPYCIVVGAPAKVISRRFCDSDIELLLKTEWWKKDLSWLRRNISSFHSISRFRQDSDLL